MLDQQELVKSIRTWKKTGELAAKRQGIVPHISELSTARLEKVGNLLKDVRVQDWQASTTELKPLKVAILSNFTCHSFANYLRPLCLQEGIWPELYTADFNQYIYQLMDEQSELYRFRPDLVVCLLDEHVVTDELPKCWTVEDVADVWPRKVQQLEELISLFEQRSGSLFVLNTIPLSLETHHEILDYKSKARLSVQWRKFQAELLHLSDRHKQVVTLDFEVLQQDAPSATLNDPRLAYYASMTISEDLLLCIARESVKIARSVSGLGKKCLVLDLDNTLWGGVIGDDGLSGIALGGDAPGKIFVDFQKRIKHLKAQGVLLAINSKNETDNVMEVLTEHPDMQLRPADFVRICANWDPKPENLQSIAAGLNIGVDSLVFVDDNPFERNIVRELAPTVTVLELQEDPSTYVRTLLAAGYFNTVELTQEDLHRTQSYQAEAEREQFRSTVASVEDYLHGLDIHLHLLPPTNMYLPRLAQINARTNQFNMTTRRYSEALMEEMATSNSFLLRGFRSTDRFGDNGIVGSVIVEKVQGSNGETWWIRNFLLSCRVFSRGLETAVLQHILRLAQDAQVSEVFAEYIPTAKNRIVHDFYTRHGFVACAEQEGIQIFRHDLHEIGATPAWLHLHTESEMEETIQ
ncbi:HAD-IIIC family phosphatase [Tumebacillus permanentifrigoris]|uniref:D-glyceryl-ACP synthase n=1 Tax=Tumebacillus permanentifrigoris TaxID=378543 RepID=A0A316DDY0_9BACL|nr:HAD-IIIC family phosphatase [Tumebacillus permanentifrigoris]PWK15000.1 D-glyceryl-ACP synthase [Tumebacillus permanentifrigoris]